MNKLEKWLYSLAISFIIAIPVAVVTYKVGIKEWAIIGFISFIFGTLLIRGIMFCLEEML